MLHTPYDGSHKPFTIGLSQLDVAEWIEVDDNLDTYLDEKKRLYAAETRNVLIAAEGTRAAQAEVLSLLVEHLLKRFPDVYALAGATVRILDGRYGVDLAGNPSMPLATAGLLVQEDLVLMSKTQAGWCLTAASLCFPSAWSLREKFNKPMHAIHAPVPGFGEGSRNAGLIERMFDNLRVDRPVIRWNWTLFGESRLYHPDGIIGLQKRFASGDASGPVTLRLERQTLRKLPQSGAILFTIRTHLNPLEVLETHADGPALAQAIADQVAAFSPDELAYKGLLHEREQLTTRLGRIMARKI